MPGSDRPTSTPALSVRIGTALLVLVLLYELPIRMLLQPDPWLLSAGHWYFAQPLRLVIEGLLLASLLGITYRFAPWLLRLPRPYRLHLAIGMSHAHARPAVARLVLEFDEAERRTPRPRRGRRPGAA